MRFRDVPGLSEVKEKLVRSVETGKVAHAQLFAGPEGGANLSLALAYATYLNCIDRRDGDSCGQCASCLKTDKLIHPDFHLIFPVSSTKNKTGKDVVSDSFITEWRQFVLQNPYGGPVEWSLAFGGENKQLNISREESRNILKKLTLKSYEGEYKIMLIWLAEHMHPTAANALLKLLEEPPEKTIFILTSYDEEQIIGTILSRVQKLQIRAFRNSEVSAYLKDKYQLEEEEAIKISNIANGSINYAQKLINTEDDQSNASFQEWMRMCFKNEYAMMVDGADEFNKMGRTLQKSLLQYGLSIIRDSLLSQNNRKDLIHAMDKDMQFANNFSRTLNLQKLDQLYQLLNTAFYHLERNGNPKIIFLDTSLKISMIFKG